MTDLQRNAINDLCNNLWGMTDLRDKRNSPYFWSIAALYNRPTFLADLDNIRYTLRNGIINKYNLPSSYQLQLAHVPFINVNDLVNRIVRAIRRRL